LKNNSKGGTNSEGGRREGSGIDRRALVKKATAACIVAPFVNRLITPASAQGTRVVNYAGYGGNYGEVLKEVYFQPFEKETGIKVNMGTGAGLALAKLQTLNPAGAEWDIVDLTNAEYTSAVREDLIASMDKSAVDTSKLLPDYIKDKGFTFVTYVWVIGHNTKAISDADAPKSWAELWDMKKYAGKRCLRGAKQVVR
jgi:putative spermidine/putrescine transport system substrate-binding protein